MWSELEALASRVESRDDLEQLYVCLLTRVRLVCPQDVGFAVVELGRLHTLTGALYPPRAVALAFVGRLRAATVFRARCLASRPSPADRAATEPWETDEALRTVHGPVDGVRIMSVFEFLLQLHFAELGVDRRGAHHEHVGHGE